MKVSWEKLKEKCIHEMASKLRHAEFDGVYAELSTIRVGLYVQQKELKLLGDTHKYIEELIKIFTRDINSCDIRNYRTLVKLFPKAFPKWIIEDKCIIDYGDDTNWYFVREEIM